MSVIRTYSCDHCSREFDSWDKMPECPDCGCVRTNWVPRGGHIAGVSLSGDAEFKALADVFKMTDMNSAYEGQAAKQVPTQAVDRNGPMRNFGGFVAPFDPNNPATRADRPSCTPAQNVKFKTTTEIGRANGGGQAGYPAVSTNTLIDSVHRPKP